MSFDAFIMPAAPQPRTGAIGSSPGTEPASFKLYRPVQSADQKKSFLATLNRVSERKSCSNPEARAGAAQTAKPARPNTQSANPANNRKIVDQDPFQDREAQSDSNSESTNAVLPQLMGHFQSEGKPLLAGLVGIGPFEQLQIDISPEANNLSFFEQQVNRAIVHQLAADPSGPHTDNPFFEFWRSLTATPGEGVSLGGRAAAYATTVETNGQKTAVNLLVEAQPSEMTQSASAEKDARLSAGTSKDLNVETLLEPGIHKSGENSQSAKPQPAPKAAETAVNTNLASEGITAKPSEDAVSLKTSGLPNEMLPADQKGSKVVQIDGEAKDSSFLTSQENLFEHSAKLEHAGRSAEGAKRSLASQTMNQIVQKAVLLNNSGQNAVQIDLKPDFLGHIRMHIVTESQQVAVRIVAEFPFVKDMLESNLNQLKAELQAQGLEVDELEVSVAHDSRSDDDLYQKAAEARRARALKENRFSADAADGAQTGMHTGRGLGMVETAIDYFA